MCITPRLATVLLEICRCLEYKVVGCGVDFEEAKYFDIMRATVFCLGQRLSKHKTKDMQNIGGA